MDSLLFDKSIQKLDVLFRFSGMNLHHKIRNPMDTIRHRWLYIMNTMGALIAFVISVYFIFHKITHGENIIEVTSIAPCEIFSLLAVIKSAFYLYHEKEAHQLIENIRHFEIEQNTRNKCLKIEHILKKETGFLNLVVNILYVQNCLMIIVFDMTPIILMAVKYYETKEFEMLLPYLDVFEIFPYDVMHWVLNYIIQVWSEFVVLLDMAASDCLFFTCCTYIRVHFKLLQNDLEHMIIERYSEDYEIKLAHLVKMHQNLINATEMLESIYSESMLINFLVSSLVICLTGFNVTVEHNIEVVITFLTFLFMSLMQIFFLCLFSDLLMSASLEVSEAIYNSQWYKSNVRLGRLALIVLTRSQKPCQLTTAGFSVVNLRAFMKVLSTSWSYFALLHTMYER